MTQTRYKETVDTWQTVEYRPVVKNHALVTLTPIKPTFAQEIWSSAKLGCKLGLIFWGCVLIIGLIGMAF